MRERVRVIIPAFNEAQSIAKVIQEIPDWVSEIVVANNGSSDNTAAVAKRTGATVVDEPNKGYGNACLKAMHYIEQNHDKQTDIIVFIDGDYSDYPQQMGELIDPIATEKFDFVIGSRSLGNRSKGSMTIPQVFGNRLATSLLLIIYGIKFTDLGPFRAIKWNALKSLEMKDKNFGWTVEMQLKAAKMKLKCQEIPVDYRRRIGKSKVSGTVKGTISAGYKILWTIFKYM